MSAADGGTASPVSTAAARRAPFAFIPRSTAGKSAARATGTCPTAPAPLWTAPAETPAGAGGRQQHGVGGELRGAPQDRPQVVRILHAVEAHRQRRGRGEQRRGRRRRGTAASSRRSPDDPPRRTASSGSPRSPAPPPRPADRRAGGPPRRRPPPPAARSAPRTDPSPPAAPPPPRADRGSSIYCDCRAGGGLGMAFRARREGLDGMTKGQDTRDKSAGAKPSLSLVPCPLVILGKAPPRPRSPRTRSPPRASPPSPGTPRRRRTRRRRWVRSPASPAA